MGTTSVPRANRCQMIPSLGREHFWSQDQQWKTYINTILLCNALSLLRLKWKHYIQFIEVIQVGWLYDTPKNSATLVLIFLVFLQ